MELSIWNELTLECIDHAHDEQHEDGAHADNENRHLSSAIAEATLGLLGAAWFAINHGEVHGAGYGHGVQIFGAYVLQIGISIDGNDCILGVAGQCQICIIIGRRGAVAMHTGQLLRQQHLVLPLLFLVYLGEAFQIRGRQQQRAGCGALCG